MDNALPTDVSPNSRESFLDSYGVPAARAEAQQTRESSDALVNSPQPTVEGAVETANNVDKADPFKGLPPVDHLNDLMSQSPWLIGLAAIGGKMFGVPAQAMLSATNGMVSGLIKGDQQAYEQEKQKYDSEYDRWSKKHAEIRTYYMDMLKARKDDVMAHEKAAQDSFRFAGQKETDVNMAWRIYSMNVNAHERVTATREAISERAQHHAALEANAADKAAKGGGTIENALSIVDDIEKSVDKKTIIGTSSTGAGGMVSRGAESVANLTGVSGDTTAHDLQSSVETLQMILPKALSMGSRTSKDEREKVLNIVRGMKAGDTPENTKTAMSKIRKLLTSIANKNKHGDSEKYEVGKVYIDAEGHRAKYNADGTWTSQ